MLQVPAEYLNSIDVPELPPRELRLKRGMPVMLLRNVDPARGLCNGTRLLVQEVRNGRLLQAQIVGSARDGDVVLIPRMRLLPNEGAFPFEWARVQFRVRVAFAMTINKAQGQTLDRVVVFLREPVFAHGQLYVAASRVGRPGSLAFATPDPDVGAARNVVYREALV